MAEPASGVDVLVVGGGVAGLWTSAVLARSGYSCVLIERGALGLGQTIASQGIIHGGIKYALTGEASLASRLIAEMPGVWRACLEGVGEVDLRAARVLSDRQYLWTTAGIGSRLVGVAASKAIRTDVRAIGRDDRPLAFHGAPGGVDVYEVEEPVLEPRSVIQALRDSAERLGVVIWRMSAADALPRLRPRALVLCAGAGNAELIRACAPGLEREVALRQQIRPLHMVMVRERNEATGALPMVYGHCVGLSDKPRVTITSQRDSGGRVVWYVGGQIAERGVEMSREELIEEARRELGGCVGWVDLRATEWASVRVDRAEGVVRGREGDRPDIPSVGILAQDGVEDADRAARRVTVVVWPTKLAFAPRAAKLVLNQLEEHEVARTGGGDLSAEVTKPDRPEIAPLPWDVPGVAWT